MEAVVHQPLGHILHGDLFKMPQVHDALVGDEAVFAPVQNWKRIGQPVCDVVGVEDGHLCGAGEILGTHHRDVHPRDGKDAGTAPCRRRHRSAVFRQRIARQKRHEMPGHTDRPDARAATAVRDAKRLVQIEMANIGADVAGAGQADLRVEIGAVHVDLPAVFVDDLANLADAPLVHAVRGGVRDHDRREVFAVFLGTGAEVIEIDIAVGGGLRAGHRHDFHPNHHCTGRIGAVRRHGDQADVAVPLPPALVIAADGQQTGKLTLRPRIGLERHGGKPGDVGQPLF